MEPSSHALGPAPANADAARTLLRVKGATLSFGRTTVLENVDFEVAEGQVWFFLGRNGTGKTTLIRSILGELPPRLGSVQMVAERNQVGFIPQESRLNRNLPTTISEFVTLGLVGTDVPRDQRAERLEWALRHTSLTGRARDSYWSLSGGQRQLAAIARALVRQPRLMILDEPTSNLDITAEREILDVIDELKSAHAIATICVSHKLELARRSATHVALFLRGGVRTGIAAEMLRDDILDEVFAEEGDGGATR
jgi:ABC-type Mn2+/Zn2+ transport system ATPase subunit